MKGRRRGKENGNRVSMKSWLDLIPLSERVHRRQSRMTRLCIVLAAALVTTIFGMADMEIRNQIQQARMSDGGWHAAFREITAEQATLIAARPQVTAGSWYGIYNYGLEEHWCIDGVETSVIGMEETLIRMFPRAEILEGTFPEKEREAVFSENAGQRLGLSIGDEVFLDTPWGERVSLTVSGFCGQFSSLNRQDAFGVFLNMDTFRRLAEAAGDGEEAYWNSIYLVAFSPFCNIQKNLAEIREQLSLRQEQVSENVKLLGLIGQSSDSYMIRLMQTGAVLAVLVMIFGVLMITGSLNSSIARRTEFFGMLRCLGATGPQISRFVRREALRWCRTAVPAGLLIGTAAVWTLSAVLKLLSSLFAEIPLFSISWTGIAAGSAPCPGRREGRFQKLFPAGRLLCAERDSVSFLQRASGYGKACGQSAGSGRPGCFSHQRGQYLFSVPQPGTASGTGTGGKAGVRKKLCLWRSRFPGRDRRKRLPVFL